MENTTKKNVVIASLVGAVGYIAGAVIHGRNKDENKKNPTFLKMLFGALFISILARIWFIDSFIVAFTPFATILFVYLIDKYFGHSKLSIIVYVWFSILMFSAVWLPMANKTVNKQAPLVFQAFYEWIQSVEKGTADILRPEVSSMDIELASLDIDKQNIKRQLDELNNRRRKNILTAEDRSTEKNLLAQYKKLETEEKALKAKQRKEIGETTEQPKNKTSSSPTVQSLEPLKIKGLKNTEEDKQVSFDPDLNRQEWDQPRHITAQNTRGNTSLPTIYISDPREISNNYYNNRKMLAVLKNEIQQEIKNRNKYTIIKATVIASKHPWQKPQVIIPQTNYRLTANITIEKTDEQKTSVNSRNIPKISGYGNNRYSNQETKKEVLVTLTIIDTRDNSIFKNTSGIGSTITSSEQSVIVFGVRRDKHQTRSINDAIKTAVENALDQM